MKILIILSILKLSAQSQLQVVKSVGIKFQRKTVLETDVIVPKFDDYMDDVSINFEDKEFTFGQISDMEMSDSQKESIKYNLQLMKKEIQNADNLDSRIPRKIEYAFIKLESALVKKRIFLNI